MNYEWLNPEETPKEWSRNTVADGKWLNKNTIVPLIKRDEKLLELIESYDLKLDDISGALADEVEARKVADTELYDLIKNIATTKIVGGPGIGVTVDENVTTISLTGSLTANYIDVKSEDPNILVTTATVAASGLSGIEYGISAPCIVDKIDEIIDEINENVVKYNDIVAGDGIGINITEVSGNKVVTISNTATTAASVLTKDIFVTNPIGDIKKGDTLTAGTPLTDIVASALNPYVTYTAAMSLNPNITLYPYPDTKTIASLSVSINAGSETVTSTKYQDIVKEVNIKPFTTGSVTYQLNQEISTNTTYSVEVNDGKTTKTATKTVEFCWPYFYGCTKDLDELDLATLTKVTQKKSKLTTTALNPEDDYIVFAYDRSYGKLKSIIDQNGYNVTEEFTDEYIEDNYAGHEYQLYVTKEVKTNTDVSFTFMY